MEICDRILFETVQKIYYDILEIKGICDMTRKEKVLGFMSEKEYVPLMFEELVAVLCVPEDSIDELGEILDELTEEGKILKTKKKRYMLSQDAGMVSGIFRGNERGFGFVMPENGDDLFIPGEFTHSAMDSDRVLARIIRVADKGKRAEGEIVKILKRNTDEFVGRYEKSRNFGFVIPDNKRIPRDIFVSKKDTMGAKDGDKVVVKITKWQDELKNHEGEIIKILGNIKDQGVDVMSVICSYGIQEEFDHKVIAETDNIPSEILEDEIKKRTDFRHLPIITIDGADAKDLDDAVCVEEKDDGYTLSVHIADVSHYVKEGSYLDKSALHRGTSVYFADRVVPMLPKKLSNGICSLNPHEDRLTLSCVMNIDKSGNVTDHYITEGVIRTVERMTYEDVTKILVDKDKTLLKRYENISRQLFTMEKLAMILRKKRFKKGSIDFDFPEAKIILDENGRAIDVVKRITTVSNHIIEEFMLCANKTVAEYMYWASMPMVYRIHEKPTEEKLDSFNDFIRNFGYSIRRDREVHPSEFAALLDKIKGTEYERMISHLMLRSLMKAEYSPVNKGHFGLAFEYYCHFTSPIRRYPDLMVHRILKSFISGAMTERDTEHFKNIVSDVARISSEKELNAMNAERDVEDIKKCEYMSRKIGERYQGIISSIMSFGMFIELENTVEGLVRVTDMKGDYYIYEESTHSLIGERSLKKYSIGDKVKVMVASINTDMREINFILED